ncbi:MAG: hypothetical protein AVDCRST_MAG12-458, partial [uncultured Rubrobacteraceae bacterium]
EADEVNRPKGKKHDKQEDAAQADPQAPPRGREGGGGPGAGVRQKAQGQVPGTRFSRLRRHRTRRPRHARL